jgi:hypothetical protein
MTLRVGLCEVLGMDNELIGAHADVSASPIHLTAFADQ